MLDTVPPCGRRDDSVRDRAERNGFDGGVNEVAVIEARVELVVADLRECRARHFVAQLDLDERIAVERLGEEVAETQEARIGERADSRPARGFAGKRFGVTGERPGR